MVIAMLQVVLGGDDADGGWAMTVSGAHRSVLRKDDLLDLSRWG